MLWRKEYNIFLGIAFAWIYLTYSMCLFFKNVFKFLNHGWYSMFLMFSKSHRVQIPFHHGVGIRGRKEASTYVQSVILTWNCCFQLLFCPYLIAFALPIRMCLYLSSTGRLYRIFVFVVVIKDSWGSALIICQAWLVWLRTGAAKPLLCLPFLSASNKNQE